MEIMLALLILAGTFIPIIASIGKSTSDTDIANSQVFAQTTAKNILDAFLDDVPYQSISAGSDNIAKLEDFKYKDLKGIEHTYKVSKFLDIMGTGSGNSANRTLQDERGYKYQVTIKVWPIFCNRSKTHATASELLFAYLPRPLYEKEINHSVSSDTLWYAYPPVAPASDDRYAYIQTGHAGGDVHNPYDLGYYNVATSTKNAYQLGALKRASSSVMMKVLLTITWGPATNQKKIELYTMKANLDPERN